MQGLALVVSPCLLSSPKAGERIRTVNIQLGRLMLYQLSYARIIKYWKQ
jgi:hypothetical protein